MSVLTPRGLILPGGTPRIDWSNSITNGLVGCWVTTGEGGANPVIRDLVSQGLATVTGSGPAIIGTARGLTAAGTTSQCWTASVPPAFTTLGVANQVTTLWFGSVLGVSNTSAPCSIFGISAGGGTNVGIGIFERNDSNTNISFGWANSGGLAERYTIAGVLSSGGVYSLLGSVTSHGTAYIYSGGQLIGREADASGGSAYFAEPNVAVTIGSNPSLRTRYSGCGLYVGCIWNRQLSPGESATISADPTNFLLFEEDMLWATPVGGVAPNNGSGIGLLKAILSAGAGASHAVGSGTSALGRPAASGAGTTRNVGHGIGALGAPRSAGSGAARAIGSGSGVVRLFATGSGASRNTGTGTGELGAVAAHGSGIDAQLVFNPRGWLHGLPVNATLGA